MLSAALLASLTISATGPVQWLHDDWAAAKKQANAENQLVAVDVWATWCHTCLSMKNYVLKEDAMKRVATKHTWLALDYDQPANAAFFKKFPINAFPTFMVIDPKTDEVVARWLGSGTADQMASFFASASRSAKGAVSEGQRLLAKGEYGDAIALFERALKQKQSKAERTRVLSGYIEALWKGDVENCAMKALPYIDETDDTAPGIDYAAMIAYCAESGAEKDKPAIMKKVRARLERAVANPKLALTPDDKSGLYSTLISAHRALGDDDKADAALQSRLQMLEAAAKAAPDAKARSTFDAHRLSCYLQLKRYDDAEKMLKVTAAALPKEFNTPWRLALLDLERGHHDAALKSIDHALTLGYGPRRLRLHATKIDILMAAKRDDDAKKAMTAARAEVKRLDPALVRKSWIAKLDRQQAKLDASRDSN